MANGIYLDWVEKELEAERSTVANQIYRTYLPLYLQEFWEGARAKWYHDWLKEQLDILVMNEITDWERLEELKGKKETVSLIFGVFGAAFRILDHIGMHLRGQTMGQYELLPEDRQLLHQLCRQFLVMKQTDWDPFVPDENISLL